MLKKYLPPFIRDHLTARGYRNNRYYKRIIDLDIKDSGMNSDGFPFIALNSGLCFFSYLPTNAQKIFYGKYLPKSVKEKLKVDCINVARDIVMRYQGPASSKDFFSEGKYYDLKEGDVVIEIGAYIGYYAMRAAEIVGNKGRVIAIEAIEENYRLMNKNIKENKFDNILPVHKATHYKTGELEFYRESNQIAGAAKIGIEPKQKLTVPCDSLDHILDGFKIDRVDFIRVQVNGAELDVLKGMKKTLKSHPKLMIAAIYKIDGQPAWRKIGPIIRDMGYMTRIDKGNIFAYHE